MDKKWVGVLIVLLIIGVFAVAMGVLPSLDHNVAVQESQETAGTVQALDIDVTEDDDGDESYSPVVTYQYTVDGQTYTADNVFPGQFDRYKSSRSWAQGIVNSYSVGEEIPVYYRGYEPSQAYIRNEGLPDSWLFGIGYAALAAVAGVWFVYVGFKRWRQRQWIENTPTENAQSLSIGPSEIEGYARPGKDSPMTAPFSTEECVVAEYEIKQYEEDDGDEGGSWKTIESDVLHVPFTVNDATGELLVRPHDEATYDLDPGDWTETYVDSSDRGPGPIQRFVRNHESVSFPSDSAGRENDRNYRQNLIRSDKSVYVFGTVQPRDSVEAGGSQADRLVVEKVEDGSMREPMFLISDDEQTDLIDRRRWALWRLPVGALFLAGALAIVLFIFGLELGLRVPVFR